MDNKKVGAEMRKIRKKAGVGMRAQAEMMKLSHSYTCLLEQGLRNWRPSLMDRYVEAIMVWQAMDTNNPKEQ
jgi:predicted transcriptional regulator